MLHITGDKRKPPGEGSECFPPGGFCACPHRDSNPPQNSHETRPDQQE
nr:MAG TPA: hypothetical protein [Caudoviricetes sp.]